MFYKGRYLQDARQSSISADSCGAPREERVGRNSDCISQPQKPISRLKPALGCEWRAPTRKNSPRSSADSEESSQEIRQHGSGRSRHAVAVAARHSRFHELSESWMGFRKTSECSAKRDHGNWLRDRSDESGLSQEVLTPLQTLVTGREQSWSARN